MKKNILLHIGGLGAGGAEKSLVSLLNTLPKDLYNVDLMLINKGGLFMNMIPKHINVIETPFPYCCFGISPSNWKYYIKHNPKYFAKKLWALFKLKKAGGLPVDQVLWPLWKECIPCYGKEYDVAISYIEGMPNYYVIDKIKAKRKILWIHNEYTKLGYNKDFDRAYFDKADAIVTISDICLNDLVYNFPEYKEKCHILENITNPVLVRNMADEGIDDPMFENKKGVFRILSVGRLFPQKNYRLAIDAAKIVKEHGIVFKWYIIGEGVLKEKIIKQIDSLSLNDNIVLLGLRSNPYPYIKQCDIIVQSSLFEGKSIAIDEAKILYKPIVSTNYKTVYDTITDRENGLICEMTPQSLANGIMELYSNADLAKQLTANLIKEDVNNVKEIDKYISLFENQ